MWGGILGLLLKETCRVSENSKFMYAIQQSMYAVLLKGSTSPMKNFWRSKKFEYTALVSNLDNITH